MPMWLFVAINILWVLWSIYAVSLFLKYQELSKKVDRYGGRLNISVMAHITFIAYVPFTVLWLCYAILKGI